MPDSQLYVPRYADRELERLLTGLPAVLVVGPRACGKSTTARRHAATVLDLDRPATATAFAADPDAALNGLPEPVLLDEWQAVPEVLGAVKRSVDRDSRPGGFLLAGSVRAELDSAQWPGTGRVVRRRMAGLTVRERRRRLDRPLFLDAVHKAAEPAAEGESLDLIGYIELSLAGGFPDAVDLDERLRRDWIESYVEQSVTRDLAALSPGRDAHLVRRFLDAYALTSGRATPDATIYEAAGVNRLTGRDYTRLLDGIFLTTAIPAWSTNRIKRLVRMPKRLITDTALLGFLLGINSRGMRRDGSHLGQLIESFVLSQLWAELPFLEHRARLFHLRDQGGRHEIDVVAEFESGEVVAIEVKAGAAPTAGDARHLAWLRDQIGARFLAGVVLHTGPRAFSLDDRITARPISSLWS